MTQQKYIFYYAILVAVIAHVLTFVGIYLGWFGIGIGNGAVFCEATRDAIIKQPANTFSNMAFMIAGLTAAYQLSKGKFSQYSNTLTQTIFFPTFLCFCIILLSPGSIALHATESEMGGYFDMLSMYLIAAIIFTFALKRYLKLGILSFIVAFASVLVVCHIFHFMPYELPIVHFAGNLIFGVFLVSGMIIEILHSRKKEVDIKSQWAVAASLTFIISFAIWLTGTNEHPWCRPYSLLQAHAISHILDALAVYFIFRLYVSENEKNL
ncbi:MAG: ceramidase domain-containing protein [Chitinophagales bacterium]